MKKMTSTTTTLLLLISIINISAAAAAAAKDDVDCLRGFKSSITDPDGALSSWNFANTTAGFICGFNGITCWNDQQNKVLSITLSSSSISGQIPSSLQYCKSINSVTLSSNSLSGPIPPSLCQWLPYIVTLDLSSNSLSGTIPPDMSECKFLNNLLLNSNQLSGSIPSLVSLDRLKNLDVSSNRLSGPIPPGLSHFDASSFQDNPASLCGAPLRSCNKKLTTWSLVIILAAGVFGAVVSLVAAYFIWRLFFRKKRGEAEAEVGREDGIRASHNRLVPVSLFQEPIVKVKLSDLTTATRDFHPDHVIVSGSSRIGTSYEAVLPDGSELTVKRLHGCPLPEKQFRAEMARMGQLRHPNLVPLLGFCVVEEERLLIYKHMQSGALSSIIHAGEDELDWPARLRIGIGASRGLAWLHHGSQVPFLHQSLSSAAVLLDEDYEPRITDFGLARLIGSSSGQMKFSEFGYVAPEYATNPVPTTRGDVYGFGVILLELATGQKAVEVSSDVAGDGFKGNLVDWVTPLCASGRISDAIDRSLRGKGHDDEIVEFLKIASCCVVPRPKERPSMSGVYRSLKSIVAKSGQTEQFDEFPLLYGNDSTEAV